MQESTPREKVLKKIRKSLINKTPNPYPVLNLDADIFNYSEEEAEVLFANKFSESSGKFVFCENELDFAEKLINLAQQKEWKNFFCMEHRLRYFLDNYEFPYTSGEDQLASANVGLTLCEALIARTGTIMVSSAQLSGRRMPGYMPVHIVLAYTSQIVRDIKDGFKLMKEKYEDEIPSMISFITGPSSTADIEGVLVQGAHGPKEIYVFLIDDNSIN